MILGLFAAQAPRFLDSKRAEFFCPCDSRIFERYLKGLPPHDRAGIREKGPFPLDITCQNCSTVYSYDEETVKRILD